MEKSINKLIQSMKSSGLKAGNISDGYHTFDELYEHRNLLFINYAKAISKANGAVIWKTKRYNDGTEIIDYFILGIGDDENQITYHLPVSLWDNTSFAMELEKGIWNGHTHKDVLKILKSV